MLYCNLVDGGVVCLWCWSQRRSIDKCSNKGDTTENNSSILFLKKYVSYVVEFYSCIFFKLFWRKVNSADFRIIVWISP